MQRAMSAHAAVFRTDELMAEGKEKLTKTYQRMNDIGVTDRSLIWNTDLVETMELDNMLSQAVIHFGLRNFIVNRTAPAMKRKPMMIEAVNLAPACLSASGHE